MININRYTKIAMAILLPAFNMESSMSTFNMECDKDRNSPITVMDITPQKRKLADVSQFAPEFYKRQCNKESVIIDNLVFFEDDQATFEEVAPSAPRDMLMEEGLSSINVSSRFTDVLDCSSTLPSPGSEGIEEE